MIIASYGRDTQHTEAQFLKPQPHLEFWFAVFPEDWL